MVFQMLFACTTLRCIIHHRKIHRLHLVSFITYVIENVYVTPKTSWNFVCEARTDDGRVDLGWVGSGRRMSFSLCLMCISMSIWTDKILHSHLVVCCPRSLLHSRLGKWCLSLSFSHYFVLVLLPSHCTLWLKIIGRNPFQYLNGVLEIASI